MHNMEEEKSETNVRHSSERRSSDTENVTISQTADPSGAGTNNAV